MSQTAAAGLRVSTPIDLRSDFDLTPALCANHRGSGAFIHLRGPFMSQMANLKNPAILAAKALPMVLFCVQVAFRLFQETTGDPRREDTEDERI